MFSAFAMLHWLSFLRLHIRDSFVLPSSSYHMVLFCFRHASSHPYVQHFNVVVVVIRHLNIIVWFQPYPTTNTPLLTTHHTLIVCEAVHCVCPCDDDRDAKENDCNDVPRSDQSSRKQLRNATILVLRRQKPSTNALDGFYLPCVDRMLDARWVEGRAASLPRRPCV